MKGFWCLAPQKLKIVLSLASFLGGAALVSAACWPSAAGLVSWWPADSGAADVVGSNPGVLEGGAVVSDFGRAGSAFVFNGTTSFVRIPDSPSLRPTNFTVEGWVWFTALDTPGTSSVGQQYIVFKQNTRSSYFEGFALSKVRRTGTDYFNFGISSSAGVVAEATSSTVVTTGVWYHVAGVRGSNFIQIYVNGQLEAQTPVAFPQSYGNFPLYFGTTGQAFWDRKLAGFLDEVTLHNLPLSANEIAGIHAAGEFGRCKYAEILAQPESRTAAIGQNVSFSVSASGFGELAYQWLKNGISVSGATGAGLALLNVQPADAGLYSVVVTNRFNSITSEVASLTVLVPPLITLEPQSLTVIEGQSAVFEVIAGGTPPISYQWRFNGTSLIGATQSSYTRLSAQAADAGDYSVVVTNLAGAVTSTVAHLTVNVRPGIVLQPANSTVNEGQTANFSVVASGTPPLHYQWRFNNTNLSGATQSSFTRSDVRAFDAGGYSVLVTNVAGAITSATASLTVNLRPAIIIQPQSVSVTQNEDATFFVVATGTAPLAYQWRYNGINLNGATGTAYTHFAAQPKDEGDFSVIVTNLAGAVTSAVASLSVTPSAPYILEAPGSTTVSIGAPVILRVVAGGAAPLDYQWFKNGTPLPGGTEEMFSIPAVTLDDGGSYDVLVSNHVGSVKSTPPAILTVTQVPSITGHPQTRTNEAGTTALFTVSAVGPGIEYRWLRNGNLVGNGTNVFGQNSPTLILSSVLATNGGVYSALVSNSAGSIISQPATLHVIDPVITQQPVSVTRTISSPGSLSVSVQGSRPISYRWYRNGDPLVDGNGFTGATAPVLNIASVTLSNQGAYFVIASNAFGMAASEVATVSALPYVTIPDVSLSNAIRCALALDNQEFITLSNMVSLKCLSACDAGIENLAGIEFAENLEALHISRNQVEDLGPIARLFKLRSLEIDQNRIISLSGLGGLTNIFCLRSGGNQVTDYDVLTNLVNLRQFAEREGNLGDLRPLQAMVGIERLELPQNRITNVNVLAGLTNLAALDLRGNYITNCDVLVSGATNLESLHLGGNPLGEVPSMAKLTKLKLLDLSDCGIEDATPLESLDGLNYLGLSRNPIRNWPVMSSLANLQGLELRGNGLTNVSFLTGLSQLRHIDVAFNELVDVSPLAGRADLGLVLDGNAITSSAVAQVNSLGRLWLNQTGVKEVSFISGFTNLTALALEGNGIVQFQPLANARRLNHLAISENPVGAYAFILNLTNLNSLRIRKNQISDLNVVGSLSTISFLDAGANQITNVAPLAALPKLANLYIDRNRIRTMDILTNVAQLTTVDMRRNLLEVTHGSSDSGGIESLRCQGARVSQCGCTAGGTAQAVDCLNMQVRLLPQNQNPHIWLSRTGADVWHIPMNAASSIELNVNDPILSEDALPVGAKSLNMAVIPDAGLEVHGTNQVRRLIVTPAQGQTGLASIVLTVTNEVGLTADLHLDISVEAPVPISAMLCPGSSSLDPLFLLSLRQVSQKYEGDLTSVDLQNVTGLDAFGDTAGFCGWSWLPNLKALNLSAANLSDIDFVTNLTRLTYLALHNTSVSDLSPIGSLFNLTNLYLSGAFVSDIGFLTALTNLATLDLDSTALTDLSILSSLPELSTLNLAGNNISNAAFLATLVDLEHLDLRYNRLASFYPLITLTNLVSLSLENNYLRDASPFWAFPELKYAEVGLNLLDVSIGSQTRFLFNSLSERGVLVDYLPQRSPPAFDLRTNWVVNAGSFSEMFFRVDSGARPGELVVVASAQGPGLSGPVLVDSDNEPYYGIGVTSTPVGGGPNQIQIAATDDAGLSSHATIGVVVRSFLPLNGNVLNPELSWSSQGPAFWFGQTVITHDGVAAAQSGVIADNEVSRLITSVEGPGRLSFWWKVSSETNYDYLELYVTNKLQKRISGEVDWRQESFNLGSGTHEVRWDYRKDKDTNLGLDAGWVDEVTFTSLPWLELLGTGAPGSMNLVLHGASGRTYDLQSSSNLVQWVWNRTVLLTNGTLSVTVTNSGSGRQFYRLAENSPPRLFALPKTSQGEFQLRLVGIPEKTYDILSSVDLLNWFVAGTVVGGGNAVWVDTNAVDSARFYRAVAR